jgi:hypothetical protein
VIVAAVDGGIVRPTEWRRVREFAVDIPASPDLLAVLGEAGAGKSTLWRGGVQAAAEAGPRVLRTEPTASETDLSFAGLSDLLAGALPAVAADIPGPQLEALEVALLLPANGRQPRTLSVWRCWLRCVPSPPAAPFWWRSMTRSGWTARALTPWLMRFGG